MGKTLSRISHAKAVAGVVLAAMGATGCGSGTAGVLTAFASASGGGGGNSPATIADLSVQARHNPATISFRLVDPESDPVDLEIVYSIPSGEFPITPATGPSLIGVPTAADPGRLTVVSWLFANDPGLGDHFTSNVTLTVRIIRGGASARSVVLGVGNDAPTLRNPVVPMAGTDAIGIVPLGVTVADSSDDVVTLQVEYRVTGTPPSAWISATAARPSGSDPPSSDVQASSEGVPYLFFWDVVADLLATEREVEVRFTGTDDALATSTLLVSPMFCVDNNREPIASLDSVSFATNPDRQRGIPVPYQVVDNEGDRVELAFQWRRPSEPFPELPRDPEGIRQILRDPTLRRQFRIATERPIAFEGCPQAIAATHDATGVKARLPELASAAGGLVARGVVGRELEILRGSSIPTPLAASWASNPLSHPVSALPVGDGTRVLVFDRSTAGGWRLRRVALSTGIVEAEIASSASGDPDAIALERARSSVLIASDVAGLWQVERVDLASGARTTLVTADGSTDFGAVRGLASLGDAAALITVGSSLIRLAFAKGSGRATTIRNDFAEPWGVAVDPLQPNRVFLAQRASSELVSLRLDTLERRPLVLRAGGTEVVPRPESIALERSGTRLLVIADPLENDGRRELIGVDLAADAGSQVFDVGTIDVGFDGASGERAGSIATGPDGLRIVALPALAELAIGGGLEQTRTICRYVRSRQVVHVDRAFDPPLAPSKRWRIDKGSTSIVASPTGTRDVFVWDSRDAARLGDVIMRVTPFDTETGIVGDTLGPKALRSPFESEAPLPMTDPDARPTAVAFADLDADGRMDLVVANGGGNSVEVLFQDAEGDSYTHAVFGEPNTTGRIFEPRSLAVGDFDGDGDLDLASANGSGRTITIFTQDSPRGFQIHPAGILSDSANPGFCAAVAAGDLDGDGDLDLVAANPGANHLAIHHQLSGGVFETSPGTVVAIVADPNDSRPPLPFALAVGDLDGDGRLDLVTANSGNDRLEVYSQTLAGMFTRTQTLRHPTATRRPESVSVADVDGDGLLDVVSASSGGDSGLAVFFQSPAGIFEPPAGPLGRPEVLDSPPSVAVADVDGDGDLDLIGANPGTGTLSVFFQRSPRQLALEADEVLSLSSGSRFVAAGDLDGDGDVDLACPTTDSTAGSSLLLLRQRSAGSFQKLGDLSLSSSALTVEPRAVAVGDLDGDGDSDVACTSAGTEALAVFLQAQPGRFELDPNVPTPSTGASPVNAGVAIADLDADGDLDVACLYDITNAVCVFMQGDPGSFSQACTLQAGSGVRTIVAGDVNSDGLIDLVTADTGSNQLSLFLQTNRGTFAPPRRLGDSLSTPGPASVAIGDLDQDGDADLVSANFGNGTLTFFFQEEAGTFRAMSYRLICDQQGGIQGVAVADVDGDGDNDVITAQSNCDAVGISYQTSPGTFEPALTLSDHVSTRSPEQIAILDLDSDADVDFVSANSGSSTLALFRQLRFREFRLLPHDVLGDPGRTQSPIDIAVGDLDSDGDPDLISANLAGDDLRVFFGSH